MKSSSLNGGEMLNARAVSRLISLSLRPLETNKHTIYSYVCQVILTFIKQTILLLCFTLTNQQQFPELKIFNPLFNVLLRAYASVQVASWQY